MSNAEDFVSTLANDAKKVEGLFRKNDAELAKVGAVLKEYADELMARPAAQEPIANSGVPASDIERTFLQFLSREMLTLAQKFAPSL